MAYCVKSRIGMINNDTPNRTFPFKSKFAFQQKG